MKVQAIIDNELRDFWVSHRIKVFNDYGDGDTVLVCGLPDQEVKWGELKKSTKPQVFLSEKSVLK